jgi:hypothetical protein
MLVTTSLGWKSSSFQLALLNQQGIDRLEVGSFVGCGLWFWVVVVFGFWVVVVRGLWFVVFGVWVVVCGCGLWVVVCPPLEPCLVLNNHFIRGLCFCVFVFLCFCVFVVLCCCVVVFLGDGVLSFCALLDLKKCTKAGAMSKGAVQFEGNVAVAAINLDGTGAAVGITTADGQVVEADRVVNAGGAWAAAIWRQVYHICTIHSDARLHRLHACNFTFQIPNTRTDAYSCGSLPLPTVGIFFTVVARRGVDGNECSNTLTLGPSFMRRPPPSVSSLALLSSFVSSLCPPFGLTYPP